MHYAILANAARNITLTPEEQAQLTALLAPQHVALAGLLAQLSLREPQVTFVVRGCVRTYTTDA